MARTLIIIDNKQYVVDYTYYREDSMLEIDVVNGIENDGYIFSEHFLEEAEMKVLEHLEELRVGAIDYFEE